MISVDEAKKIIEENTFALKPVKLSLQKAEGKILAEDVFSTIDIPAFPQSSMDGYAFLFSQWQQHKKLFVKGEIAAGSEEEILLAEGKAIRIFTGAPVPPGADTVVMQEKVTLKNNELFIEDEALLPGTNVRPKGAEIKAGELALEKGSDTQVSVSCPEMMCPIGAPHNLQSTTAYRRHVLYVHTGKTVSVICAMRAYKA